jgi:pimeloyl-ACP methyl ester carboxylesterase
LCLIHGAWHDGSCWEPLAGPLEAHGYQVLAPDLPYDDPHASYEDRIGPVLDELAGRTGSQVLVGHSMGSSYAALVAARVSSQLLVHLCPRLGPFPSPAEAPPTFREDFPFPPTNADGTSVWDADQAVGAMYPRLPAETAHALAKRLRPMVPPPGTYPLTDHPDVHTALVYATEDEIFQPAWQRFMAREVLGIEPVAIVGGHFPMLENPKSLAALLHRLVLDHPEE